MNKPETLSTEVVDLLMPRLNDEFKAAYTYRAASNWCRNVGFMKAAEFFAKESTDEFEHAKKIEDFLTDWNVIIDLPVIEKPKSTYNGLGEVIDTAYNLEYDLYTEYEETSQKIFDTGDLCVFDFLQQFRTIQNKSVAEYSDMINMLDGVNTSSKFEMLMLEKKLF